MTTWAGAAVLAGSSNSSARLHGPLSARAVLAASGILLTNTTIGLIGLSEGIGLYYGQGLNFEPGLGGPGLINVSTV